MRDYLLRVLELTRPYRGRLILGLLCGFLSGALAPTLGVSLKLAVDAVFPSLEPAAVAGAPAPEQLASTNSAPNQANVAANAPAKKKNLAARLPKPLKEKLDQLNSWFRPPGSPSKARLLLVIGFIPAAMLLRSVLAYFNIYLLSWVG